MGTHLLLIALLTAVVFGSDRQQTKQYINDYINYNVTQQLEDDTLIQSMQEHDEYYYLKVGYLNEF